jgi:hypothetical protein
MLEGGAPGEQAERAVEDTQDPVDDTSDINEDVTHGHEGSDVVQDAAITYLEAMAGFMGMVDAPKEIDPQAEAEAALAYLETLWQLGDDKVR